MAQTNNFSGLTEYVGVQRDALIVKASTEAKSLKYFDLFLGIKHSDIIPAMDNTVVLADGSSCGWNPDGSDIISEINLVVNPAEVEKEFCQRDFEKTWANYQLRWEAGRETLPFEEAFINGNISATQEALEEDLWSSGTTAYGMTGITAILDAQSAVTTNVDFSGLTIIEKVDAMVAAMPTNAYKYGYERKMNLFLGEDDFAAYVQALNAACCNGPKYDAAAEELPYLGNSRVIIVPVPGLNGSGKMVLAPARSIAYGTDIEDSNSTVDFWFERKDAKFLLRILFMAGVAVKLPGYVTYGK